MSLACEREPRCACERGAELWLNVEHVTYALPKSPVGHCACEEVKWSSIYNSLLKQSLSTATHALQTVQLCQAPLVKQLYRPTVFVSEVRPPFHTDISHQSSFTLRPETHDAVESKCNQQKLRWRGLGLGRPSEALQHHSYCHHRRHGSSGGEEASGKHASRQREEVEDPESPVWGQLWWRLGGRVFPGWEDRGGRPGHQGQGVCLVPRLSVRVMEDPQRGWFSNQHRQVMKMSLQLYWW